MKSTRWSDNLSPSHSYFSFGIICGRLWGSLAVEDHLRSILGIICGWGSFAVGDHLRYCTVHGLVRAKNALNHLLVRIYRGLWMCMRSIAMVQFSNMNIPFQHDSNATDRPFVKWWNWNAFQSVFFYGNDRKHSGDGWQVKRVLDKSLI